MAITTMREHIEACKQADKAIREGQVKLARLDDERSKHQTALDAATHRATELRTKAAHAAALAAIGEGADDDARRLDEEATAAEKRVSTIAATLSGMTAIRASTEAAIGSARAERKAAVLRALDVRAEAVVTGYLAAADAFVGAVRRVHAIQFIRRSLGDNRTLFRSRECIVPAIAGDQGGRRLVGAFSDMLYSAEAELRNSREGPQAATTEAVLEELSDAGLEV